MKQVQAIVVDLKSQCWSAVPSARPTFVDAKTVLEQSLESNKEASNPVVVGTNSVVSPLCFGVSRLIPSQTDYFDPVIVTTVRDYKSTKKAVRKFGTQGQFKFPWVVAGFLMLQQCLK